MNYLRKSDFSMENPFLCCKKGLKLFEEIYVSFSKNTFGQRMTFLLIWVDANSQSGG
jgi:hypothetical protein